MAAALDIGVDGVAHLPGPVFVMADEDDAVVAVEDFGPEMQIVLAGEVDRVAGSLGPAEEDGRHSSPSPTRRISWNGRWQRPIPCADSAARWRAAWSISSGTRGASGGSTTKPRHQGRSMLTVVAYWSRFWPGDALIMVRPAPGVVGGPGAGGGDLQDAARLAARLPGRTMKRCWQRIGLRRRGRPPSASGDRRRTASPSGIVNSKLVSQPQPSTEHWSGVSCQRAGDGDLGQDRRLHRAVAQDDEVERRRGGADLQRNHVARRIGDGGRCSTRSRRARRPCRDIHRCGRSRRCGAVPRVRPKSG